MEAFLLYLPLYVPGTGLFVDIPSPIKVRFKKVQVPVKLVLGAPRGAFGQLTGLGIEMGKRRQLVRMDYHAVNLGHGGARGRKRNEVDGGYWADGPFHYHVMKWNQ